MTHWPATLITGSSKSFHLTILKRFCFFKQKMPVSKCRGLWLFHLCHKGRSSFYTVEIRCLGWLTWQGQWPLSYNLKSEIFQKKIVLLFFSVADRIPIEEGCNCVRINFTMCRSHVRLFKHTKVFFQFSRHQFLSWVLCLSITTHRFPRGTLEVWDTC